MLDFPAHWECVTCGYAIDRLKEHLGHLSLNKIKRIHLDSFITKRQKAGVSARTVNLEITIFRNVLNRAIDQELISTLPTENLRPLKSTTVKRELTPAEGIERLCTLPFQSLFFDGRLAGPGEQGAPLLNARQCVESTSASVSGSVPGWCARLGCRFHGE